MELMLEPPAKKKVLVENGGSGEAIPGAGFNRRFLSKSPRPDICTSTRVIFLLSILVLGLAAALITLVLNGHASGNPSCEQTNANISSFDFFIPTDESNDPTDGEGSGFPWETSEALSNITESWDFLQPRCFSLCEPPKIFSRQDKLVKTVVVHNGYRPVRYYMWLFPDQPPFSPSVSTPLFLTPLLEAGRIEEAQASSRVLKTLPSPRQVESYAGFFTVNKTTNSNIFFWFFPAENGNKSAPVVLWLQGGPGATSMFGLLKEHGPFHADLNREEEPVVTSNPYTWTKEHSVIYVDNPVGTGFSFTDSPEGYPKKVEESTEDLYEALQQFYTLFPDLQNNQFFAFGESYGGKYVPTLAFKIHTVNQALTGDSSSSQIRIPLAGIGVGNGWMSPIDQGKYASYLFFHGLLDKKQYAQLDYLDGQIIDAVRSQNWLEAWKASDDQLNFVLSSLNYSNLYDISQAQFQPHTMNFWHWLQKEDVRKAIHVGDRSFSDGLNIYMSMIGDTMRSSKYYIQEVMKHYKVVAYHGALDIICHYPGAEDMFSKFNKTEWDGHEQFMESGRRPWWVYNQDTGMPELAGYVKAGGNLRLVLMRNAGHSAPLTQPQWTLRLLEDFIQGTL